MSKVKYNRIVLKLSGEALAGEKGFGINPPLSPWKKPLWTPKKH